MCVFCSVLFFFCSERSIEISVHTIPYTIRTTKVNFFFNKKKKKREKVRKKKLKFSIYADEKKKAKHVTLHQESSTQKEPRETHQGERGKLRSLPPTTKRRKTKNSVSVYTYLFILVQLMNTSSKSRIIKINFKKTVQGKVMCGKEKRKKDM